MTLKTPQRAPSRAADEIARQLRLRDLAGLIVVRFHRHGGKPQQSLGRASDEKTRSRTIGRVSRSAASHISVSWKCRASGSGTGVLEGSTIICPHCAGVGTVRSTSSIALHVLRLLEDALIRAPRTTSRCGRGPKSLFIFSIRSAPICVTSSAASGVAITIAADDSLIGAAYHTMERGEPGSAFPNCRTLHRRLKRRKRKKISTSRKRGRRGRRSNGGRRSEPTTRKAPDANDGARRRPWPWQRPRSFRHTAWRAAAFR